MSINPMIRLAAACAMLIWLSGCGGSADAPAASAAAAALDAAPVDARHRRRPAPAEPLVVKVGGVGTVVSNPVGINCDGGASACSQAFAAGTSVTLDALAGPGETFVGWTGACSGSALSCAVAMNSAQSVDALFTPAPAPAAAHHLVSDPYPLKSAQPDHFDVACDGAAAVTSPPASNADGTRYLLFSLTGLPAGSHTCDVTAADASNQQSPAVAASFTL